jgi:O-antigen/teichoic acid export membrane protein
MAVAAQSNVSLRTRAASGSVWAVLGTVVGAPITLLCTVLLARFLGVAEFGRYALLLYAVTLASTLSDLGLTLVLQRRIALLEATDDAADQLRGAQQALLVMAFRMAVVVCTFAVLAGTGLSLALVMVGAIIQVFPSGASVLLTATSRNATTAKVALGGTLLGYPSLVIAGALTKDADFAFGVFLIASNVPRLVLLILTEWSAWRLIRPRLIRATAAEWRFGLLAFLNRELSTLVFGRSELLFFPSHLADQRGGFAAATTVSSRLTLAIDSLFSPIPFALATVFSRGESEYRRALGSVFRLSAAMFVLTFPGLMVLAATAAPYLFPPEFGDLSGAIIVLSAVSLLQSSANPALAGWVAEGVAGPLLVAGLVAGGVDLLSSAFIVPLYGLTGAVICNACSGAIYIAWLYIAFRGRLPGRDYRRYIATVVGAVVLGMLLALAVVQTPMVRLAAGAVYGAVGIFASLLAVHFFVRLGANETAYLKEMRFGRPAMRLLARISRSEK